MHKWYRTLTSPGTTEKYVFTTYKYIRGEMAVDHNMLCCYL